MEHKAARKQKSRRLTEMSQNSLKLVEDISEEVIPPIVPREIFDYLSQMIHPGKCSKKILYHAAIKLVKVSTNSTWVELFLAKKNKLKYCGCNEKKISLSLDPEDNLPAYCIKNKTPVLITNPHTSTMYSKFPTKIQGFSTLTQQQLKLYSTASIPLYVIII